MSLASGSKLVHYEILGPLGAGAMGEVYRAKDTRLDRDVAIKVLPEHFAEDEERLRRFEREAKTLASLNHPNVAQIFGVDQVESTYFLVLELVPGESLEERLKRGPLPLDEALDVARQIAEGLEAAHEAGVIHRDLKPANVRLTPDGKVKVLDFGLAKNSNEGASGSKTDSVLSTEAGRLLGTPTYMAPEQARGRPIDRRVDVWAFGCVLYECLTAQRAFVGDTLTDVLAAVLEREADLTRLPATTPPRVRELLVRCLAKDPRQRLRDIGEARLVLLAPRAGASDAHRSPTVAPPSSTAARALPWAVAALLGGTAAFFALREPAQPVAATRAAGYRVSLQRLADQGSLSELSPDGRLAVCVVKNELWLRKLDESDARKLEGTEGASSPFWSADSRQIGFFAGGKLKRIGVGGGTSVATLADHPSGSAVGTWSSNGTILVDLTESSDAEGLYILEPGATALRKLRNFDRGVRVGPDKSFPCFLPDGEHFLFTHSHEGQPYIQVGSIRSEETLPLIAAASLARYAAPGYVLYSRDGALLACAFDANSLALRGEPQELARSVDYFAPTGAVDVSVSQVGTLLFHSPDGGARFEWRDRTGRELGVVLETEQRARHLALSPDGRRLVYALVDPRNGTTDLWMLDLERNVPSRLTFAPQGEYAPSWDPTGVRLAFAADWKGPPNLFVLDSASAEPRELVPFDRHVHWFPTWTPDGRSVVYSVTVDRDNSDLWIVDVETGARRELFATKFAEVAPVVSPDGRQIAFVSDRSGREEVYLTTFPEPGEQVRVSVDGGTGPRWGAGGKELLFVADDGGIQSVALDLDGQGRVHPARPEFLFRAPDGKLANWDVSSDAQRILLLLRKNDSQSRADSLLIDWPQLLRE